MSIYFCKVFHCVLIVQPTWRSSNQPSIMFDHQDFSIIQSCVSTVPDAAAFQTAQPRGGNESWDRVSDRGSQSLSKISRPTSVIHRGGLTSCGHSSVWGEVRAVKTERSRCAPTAITSTCWRDCERGETECFAVITAKECARVISDEPLSKMLETLPEEVKH